ncbi:glycoside hydrolase superfamily [Lipomyces doorenjongii]
MLLSRYVALAATALSVVSAKHHVHHRHRRAPVALPEALDERSANGCECYTYVTSWLVDYVPTTTSSSMTTPTASVESISSISYTSTDVQYVYVTVYPSSPSPTNISTSATSFEEDVTKTKTVTSVHTSTTTTSVKTTLIITPSPSTTSTLSPTPTTSPTSTTSSSEIDSTSTFFSTVTVFVTVTPMYSTVYTTTAFAPGTYTLGDLTTTVTAEETIVVPCSTQTIVTLPWPTSSDAIVVTSYVTASPTEDMPIMIVTATVEDTVYTTVSCTPGTYTIGGVVTTVTETTAIVATTTPSAAAALRRRDEVAMKFAAKRTGPWGITYAPYTAEGVCKTAEEVASDIHQIASKGFRAIRLYSTDCASLTTVGDAAAAESIKLILGVSLNEESGLTGAQQQVSAIIEWPRKSWDVVDMVVVGNEAIFNGFVTASDLAAFLVQTRKVLRERGYLGPVTTAETLTVVDEHRDILCPAIDAVGVNVQPFFDSSVRPQDAGIFVREQISNAEAACNFQLPAVVLEAGWPSAATEVHGFAVAGKQEQELAIRSIREATDAKGNVVYFTFVDDEWKSPGVFGVERRFGCVDLF